jgi:hypothetical protein
MSIKAGYLYIFNTAFSRVASIRNQFIDDINFSRISEDTYLEVKMLKEELGIDEWVKTQPKAYGYTATTINLILKVLELKYDSDENVQT